MHTLSKSPNIAVIGPGALGTLFAARLALHGVNTLLFDHRPARAALLAEQGLTFRDSDGEHTLSVPVSADPCALANIDYALVLVKAYQTATVAALLAEALPPHAVALTLQNGLGNVETLITHLGSERVFGGATAQGALLVSPGVVVDTGNGPTVLGQLDENNDSRLDDCAHLLLHAGFSVSITRDLPAALWMKTILNAAINPVAALTRLRNGQLAEHEPSLALMTAAAREAAHVAHRHHIDLEPQDWRARLQTICRATASNINSMLQDVRQHRRTEIDAINGAILRTAEQHHLPTPVNRTLCYLLNTLEQSYNSTF